MIKRQNSEGGYETICSNGWETEEFVTLMAVDELEQLANEAMRRVKQGVSSPLEYHMYAKRLDILGLAQATGFFQWQIKRHLKLNIFQRLSEKKIKIYLNALGINRREFQSTPDHEPLLESCQPRYSVHN